MQGAHDLLVEQGYNPAIFSFPTIKPIDKNIIQQCAKDYELIVTCEEHSIIGGFGSAVAEVVAEMECKMAYVLRIGLNDVYAIRVGDQKYLRKIYGIDAQSIVDRILERI